MTERRLTKRAASDGPVKVDPALDRQRDRDIAARGLPRPIENERVRYADVPDERLGICRGVLHGDAEDAQAVRLLSRVDALEAGHLVTAQRAPRRPGVDPDRIAPALGEMDRAAVADRSAISGRSWPMSMPLAAAQPFGDVTCAGLVRVPMVAGGGAMGDGSGAGSLAGPGSSGKNRRTTIGPSTAATTREGHPTISAFTGMLLRAITTTMCVV